MPSPKTGSPVESDAPTAPAAPTTTPETTEYGPPNLTQIAHQHATGHVLASDNATIPPPYLLHRLPRLTRRLEDIQDHFSHADSDTVRYSVAAEWVLDNFYIIQQALRQIRQDLSPKFYRELPWLEKSADATSSDYAGFPRVYALARDYSLLENCHVDMQRVERLLHAYQEIKPLTMGEVWALPIMLRFSLLQCLAQTAGNATELTSESDDWPPALHFTPAAPDVEIIANCILSLRLLDSHNWKAFFEAVNLTEKRLRDDPARLYQCLTFTTRDDYRKVVEELALGSREDEMGVAHTAVSLAQSACPPTSPTTSAAPWIGLHFPPAAHVGYYLLGSGRRQLEQAIAFRPTGRQRAHRWLLDHAIPVYTGSISLLTLLGLAFLLAYGLRAGGSTAQLLLIALIGAIPITLVAVGLVNWLVTLLTQPRTLPRLNFEQGVPDSCRTMIVIPALLTSAEEVRSLLAQLEMHYLRNPDPNFGFALLTDFADAPLAEMPEDAALVAEARAGVESLNGRYPHHRPFYFCHRRRQYNPGEGVWMGWERKRGKLHEFNRLLQGADPGSYTELVGELGRLPTMRYVITLDADTILPLDAAHRLVGVMAHPLNQPRRDPSNGRFTTGYTILQPRTEIQPTVAGRSLFHPRFRRRRRVRPLHAGRLRRLPGLVRRRHFRRQRHLRRGRL
jgi:cyclic beta-1,2-glucan synthetase